MWEKYTLYSLADMLRFFPGLAVIAGRNVIKEAFILIDLIHEGRGNDLLAAVPSAQLGILDTLREVLSAEPGEMPLSHVMTWKIESLAKRVERGDDLTVNDAQVLLKELHNDLIRELSVPYFLMIPAERRRLYEQRAPLFGPGVAAKFEGAGYDIAAAGRCVALDEWTAAVFHLMRVLEKGLHALAGELQVPMTANLEVENWKNIIDQIEKKIRELEQLPKGPVKSETLRVYSQLASGFWYFKEAWRNHVSHSRATYDERAGLTIYNQVQAFMDNLAEALP